MFCPQCGQQQVSGVVRFCSRCGFPMDGVMQLLGTGGMMPVYHQSSPDEPVAVSARRKGVKQGGLLLLSGILIVPILGLFASFSNAAFPQLLAALAAIICFIGGPLRMLYAALFEEGAPRRMMYGPAPMPMMQQQFGPPPRQNTALPPPPPVRAPANWRRPNTAELVNQPSVTENTTRLLDKEDRTDR